MWACMDAMDGMGGWMAGMAIFWVIFLLVLLALAIAALVWLVRAIRGGADRPSPAETVSAGRAELDRRYGSGEISREEYLQRRADIST